MTKDTKCKSYRIYVIIQEFKNKLWTTLDKFENQFDSENQIILCINENCWQNHIHDDFCGPIKICRGIKLKEQNK